MSELRAPDPTLSTPTLMANDDGTVFATHDDETHCSIVWPDGERGPAIACVSTPTHFLGHHRLRHWAVAPLRDAAYIAVPCRECWPSAPPPGQVWSRYVLGRVETDVEPYLREPVYLRWQVQP